MLKQDYREKEEEKRRKGRKAARGWIVNTASVQGLVAYYGTRKSIILIIALTSKGEAAEDEMSSFLLCGQRGCGAIDQADCRRLRARRHLLQRAMSRMYVLTFLPSHLRYKEG